MAKKNTYAAMMKQLSSKKAKYEKGLEEANRTGNRSGIADYNRRLQRLTAGMDELFQAQEASKAPKMAMGGSTLPKANLGMDTDPRKLANAQHRSMANDGTFNNKDYEYFLSFKGKRPENSMYRNMMGLPNTEGEFFDRMTKLVAEAKAAGVNPSQGYAAGDTSDFGQQERITGNTTGDGFTADEYMKYLSLKQSASTGNTTPQGDRMLAEMQRKVDAAKAIGIDPTKGWDGRQGTNYSTAQGEEAATAEAERERERQMRMAINTNAEDSGPNPYAELAANDDRIVEMPYDGTPGVYHKNGKMYRTMSNNKQYLLTEPMLKDYQDNGKNNFYQNMNEGVYFGGGVAQSETNSNIYVPFFDKETRLDAIDESPAIARQYGESSRNAMLDALEETTPTTTPTPDPSLGGGPRGGGSGSGRGGSGSRSAEVTRPEDMVPLDLLGPKQLNSGVAEQRSLQEESPYGELLVDMRPGSSIYEDTSPVTPTKSHGLSDLKNRLQGSQRGARQGLGPNGQALGMMAGGLAQLLPTMASMKQMERMEGPVDMPMQRVQQMETDLQVGKQMQQIKDAEARSAAAIAANVSNPVVAAAMRRAGQQATQKSMANLLGNEASQEMQLRNQNLRQMTDTINQNAMIQAQNRQRNIDFENDRIASMNRMRMSMGDTLGGIYTDMQRMALDREKMKYMREAYDPYNLGATDEERNQ